MQRLSKVMLGAQQKKGRPAMECSSLLSPRQPQLTPLENLPAIWWSYAEITKIGVHLSYSLCTVIAAC
ncbi:Ankyrin repeat domain-containing protein 50 [Fusarium oxysporum f. sp. albedinis]|nr:Ankyrin repeat domain-containing protein 50 [Fusarium oxysporum f. sp. albedinis]